MPSNIQDFIEKTMRADEVRQLTFRLVLLQSPKAALMPVFSEMRVPMLHEACLTMVSRSR
jgi:hypothetical protein